ncbi:MAG TPA: hypothetical protein PLQ76_01115 [bacterium]|nr:hypothetical protein [bacterium]
MSKKVGYAKLVTVIFLLMIFGVFVADRVLIAIEAKRMPEEFMDHEFLLYPYKKSSHFTGVVYGDLTDLRTKRLYGHARKTDVSTDDLGFMSPLGSRPDGSDVVVIGDSFTQGPSNKETVAGLISGRSGHVAYNMGFGGYPVNSALAFLSDFQPLAPRDFSGMRQKTLVFVLCKRNLAGESVSEIIARFTISPEKLERKKLNREVFRYFPHNIVKYAKRHSAVIKSITPYAAGADEFLGRADPASNVVVGRDGVLFLPDDVGFSRRSISDESIKQFADVMLFMKTQAGMRGFKLIVALVPDKSDVYPGYLPKELRPREGDTVAAHFDKVVQALNDNGVESINVLPVLRMQAREHDGLYYYYPDDTHWNPRGMKVAADLVLHRMGPAGRYITIR